MPSLATLTLIEDCLVNKCAFVGYCSYKPIKNQCSINISIQKERAEIAISLCNATNATFYGY